MTDPLNLNGHQAGVPTNPADALFGVLNTLVVQFGDTQLDSGWPGVLKAEVDSAEFIQRHSEVVGLLDAVQAFVLSSARLQPIYADHIPIWYRAIVFREHWSARASELMSLADLKLLGTVGTEMDRQASSPRPWNNKTREQLDAILSSWEEVCVHDSLPELVRRDLRSRIDQIRWLIENVTLVGVDRVVRETTVLVGTGSQAMARGGPGVAKKVGIALAATVLFLGQAEEATEHISGIIEGTETIIQQIKEFPNPPKQLEPAPPKQLEPGHDVASGGED